MAPNPDLFIDLDPSEAGSEVVKTVVLPWSGQSTPLRIPAGLSDGAILRLPGIGPATAPGGPPRDAYVQVRIVPGGGGTVPMSFGAAPFGAPGPVPPVTSAPPTTPFGAPPVSAPPTAPFGTPPVSGPPTTPFGAGPPVSAPPTAPYGTPPVSAPPTNPFGAPPVSAAPYGTPPVSGPPTNPFGAPPPVSGPPTGPYGAPPVSGPPTGPYGTPPVSGPPTAPFGAGPPGPPYGPPPQFGAFPPPPRKSGRGKIIAIVGGAVAVVLLVALAVPLLIWAGNRDDDPPSNRSASGAGGEPSPSAAPISAQEYQALLAEVDKAVAPGFTQLGAAKNPKAVGIAAGTIGRALDQQISALSRVVPPQNAATAHADLLRGLEGMIDSITETGSAAGAGEVCLGSSALARLSRDTSADDIRTAQQALAAADPAQPYQVGKFVPKKTADGNRRLSNGAYIKRVRSGQGQLKIENGGSSDAVINLVLGSAKSPTVSVYVRAKGKHTVSSVKDGTYRIYMTGGKDWDARAKAFSRNCNFQRFEDTFKFTTTSSQYTIWTITLTPVAGGNAQTSEVDPNAFPGG
ncbi:hypothetical protein [Plantactinospora endophytica]|uniref:Uncharacterized protein n=1 Tax=Plantactinospora endophytica TaxID=673535 RepID=A0ABQ4EE19_9ACTN|nr:hypothetical protein [Plantactinospora endophytica]GIG92492.1 hypothetical protein Pen02_74280 [Plantactinospora endophytica]